MTISFFLFFSFSISFFRIVDGKVQDFGFQTLDFGLGERERGREVQERREICSTSALLALGYSVLEFKDTWDGGGDEMRGKVMR
jgi:hypothetical protein